MVGGEGPDVTGRSPSWHKTSTVGSLFFVRSPPVRYNNNFLNIDTSLVPSTFSV